MGEKISHVHHSLSSCEIDCRIHCSTCITNKLLHDPGSIASIYNKTQLGTIGNNKKHGSQVLFVSHRVHGYIQRRMEDNKHANGLSIIIGCDLYSTYSIYLYMHTGVLRIALYYTDLQGVCQKEKNKQKLGLRSRCYKEKQGNSTIEPYKILN